MRTRSLLFMCLLGCALSASAKAQDPAAPPAAAPTTSAPPAPPALKSKAASVTDPATCLAKIALANREIALLEPRVAHHQKSGSYSENAAAEVLRIRALKTLRDEYLDRLAELAPIEDELGGIVAALVKEAITPPAPKAAPGTK